jgi:hypothetical protein
VSQKQVIIGVLTGLVNIASAFGECIKSGLSDVTESSQVKNYKKKNESVL